jgi:dihydroflavonol-4-reductase
MWAQFTGTRPATTREQAKMVGQFYWYSHAKAQTELGYAPGPARAAIAKAVAALVSSPHVSVALRQTLSLGREVYDAHAALSKEAP